MKYEVLIPIHPGPKGMQGANRSYNVKEIVPLGELVELEKDDPRLEKLKRTGALGKPGTTTRATAAGMLDEAEKKLAEAKALKIEAEKIGGSGKKAADKEAADKEAADKKAADKKAADKKAKAK